MDREEQLQLLSEYKRTQPTLSKLAINYEASEQKRDDRRGWAKAAAVVVGLVISSIALYPTFEAVFVWLVNQREQIIRIDGGEDD